MSGLGDRPIRWIVDDATKFTAREVRRSRRYDGILRGPPKFGRGPTGEVWRLEEHLAPLLADCRRLLDADSRFLVLTVYAVRMSAIAIGELLRQVMQTWAGTSSWRNDGTRGGARAAVADGDLRPVEPAKSAKRESPPGHDGAPATISNANAASSLRAPPPRRLPPPRQR